MRQGRSLHVAALGLLAALLGGCLTPGEQADSADAEVGALLDKLHTEVLSGREREVLQPAPAAKPEPVAPQLPPEGEGPSPGGGPGQESKAAGRASEADLTAPLDSSSPDAIKLDLRSSLALAVGTGREYLDRQDSLYLAGLSLTLTRYNFGPILNSTISTLWHDSEGQPSSTELLGTFGVSQILDTGGTATFDSHVSRTHIASTHSVDTDGDPFTDPVKVLDPVYSSGLGFDLSQPLLRGSGYLVSHEALTQGERNVVYAVRDFELFREDFSIDVARDFYDLVSRKASIANLEQSWRDAVFDATKSVALRQVDRIQDVDVFNARRREIDAENQLIEARTDYKSALDDFKIKIGLATNAPVVLSDEEPVYRAVNLDEESAVAVALANRLDLMNARERLEDTERQVIIARDALQPELGLDLGYHLNNDSSDFNHITPDRWDATAALTLNLPLNLQEERNAYRAALISVDESRRNLQLEFDNVERDVRSQLRTLRQFDQQIELQKEQIQQELRAVAVTQIKYESGDAQSRDLLDARKSLVEAQNQLIDLQAQHVIARLRLFRNLGILFLGDDGMWIE
ncbi:MAG TPA: TolC family protein [Planctomycetota bacterium]|nr:TolC family protein [Planctomycetota bacterium]